MGGELGQILLLGALLVALLLGTLPLIGAQTRDLRLMRVGTHAALIQCALLAGAFGFLTWAFVQQDFSIDYVARNSNLKLPVAYRFSAVWGAHEGSLVLWILILNVWTVAVAAFSRRLPDVFMARVIGVLGFVSLGFLLFTLLPVLAAFLLSFTRWDAVESWQGIHFAGLGNYREILGLPQERLDDLIARKVID